MLLRSKIYLPLTTMGLWATGLGLAPAVWADGVVIYNPQTYNQLLAQAYNSYAMLEENDATDMTDAHLLYERALEAYHGNEVAPLDPDQVRLVQVTEETLGNDYTRVMRVLNSTKTVNAKPAKVAKLQAAYDCYALQQQAEPNASHNLHPCEGDFRELIAQLDQPVNPPIAATPNRPV
jgi:hypothetical protein